MKKIMKLFVSLAGILVLQSTLMASDSSAVLVKVPFGFVAAGIRLPAGSYRVSGSMNSAILTIHAIENGKTIMLLTLPDNTVRPDETLAAKFERVNGEAHLSGVTVSGTSMRIVKVKPAMEAGGGGAAAAVAGN